MKYLLTKTARLGIRFAMWIKCEKLAIVFRTLHHSQINLGKVIITEE